MLLEVLREIFCVPRIGEGFKPDVLNDDHKDLQVSPMRVVKIPDSDDLA